MCDAVYSTSTAKHAWVKFDLHLSNVYLCPPLVCSRYIYHVYSVATLDQAVNIEIKHSTIMQCIPIKPRCQCLDTLHARSPSNIYWQTAVLLARHARLQLLLVRLRRISLTILITASYHFVTTHLQTYSSPLVCQYERYIWNIFWAATW